VNLAQRTAAIANRKTARPPCPSVRLGEVLAHRKEFIRIDDTADYLRCRVQLHAKGIVLRDRVEGALIKTKDQQVCRAGEFLVAEIDAKVGGFGVVPPELAGSLVSSHYFLFVVDSDRLDQRFLDYYSKTPAFRDQVRAQGSTNYAAIRPSHVLGYTIPLPPLPEQRRIVAKLDRLNTALADANERRRDAIHAATRLPTAHAAALFQRLSVRYGRRPFASFSPHVTSGPRNWAKHYQTSGLRFYRAQDIGAFGRVCQDSKVFVAAPPGDQASGAILRDGDLMIVITGATVGRVAVYRSALEPGLVSQHVAICRLPTSDVDPTFVLWGLRSANGQAQLLGQRYGQGKPGLNLSNIRALALPFPPRVEQTRIASELNRLQEQADQLVGSQQASGGELDALMPALLDRAFRGEL